MKIVFLDIDGVLNHELWAKERFYRKQQENESDEEFNRNFFDPNSVSLLNHLTNKTGAKIVVSSSWRIGRSTDELRELLKSMGVEAEVIGKTPLLSFERIKYKTTEGEEREYDYSVPRGCEIKAWLEMHKGVLGDKISKVKYIILDDDSDMLFWQRNHYFRVDPYCGLTPRLIERAVHYLNR